MKNILSEIKIVFASNKMPFIFFGILVLLAGGLVYWNYQKTGMILVSRRDVVHAQKAMGKSPDPMINQLQNRLKEYKKLCSSFPKEVDGGLLLLTEDFAPDCFKSQTQHTFVTKSSFERIDYHSSDESYQLENLDD